MRGLISKIQDLSHDLSRTFSTEKVRDLLFPKFCVGCEKEGDWLCEDCLPAVFAGATEPNGCAVAGKVGYLDGVTALFDYGENAVSKLIKSFKYNYLLDTVDIFKKIITNAKLNNTWSDFVIISVPLHARRQRERGFNQAEILAELFAEKLGLDVNKNLRRVVYTTQQAKLSGEERRKNLKDAFVWDASANRVPPRKAGSRSPIGALAGEKVLLVDDVFTTGATMQECAKVLKSNGVKVVWGLALARG